MIYIAHRGNINGRQPESENNPTYILNALKLGYDVEIDIWYENGRIMIGHDKPEYEVTRDFFARTGLWNHAKNIETFEFLNDCKFRCFLHTNEDLAVTNRGDFWTFPGKYLMKNSIAVLPETVNYTLEALKNCSAICSDNIQKYKETIG